MSTTAKASDHVKPCNIEQSERHNRRDAEYIASLNPRILYVRTDLSPNNESYVAPDMQGVSLQQHYDAIKVMVKQKTGRAMQEKKIMVTGKNGKQKERNGSSPIRESVVNIKPDTTMDDLLKYTAKVQERWGIRAIQVHIHKDEGHYENPDDATTWKPNLHAHIIWDWMNHETGKSFKLGKKDMEELQDMAAETLEMERGKRKSETGHEHLERNDYIIQKQENQMRELQNGIDREKAEIEKMAKASLFDKMFNANLSPAVRKAFEEKDAAHKEELRQANTAKDEDGKTFVWSNGNKKGKLLTWEEYRDVLKKLHRDELAQEKADKDAAIAKLKAESKAELEGEISDMKEIYGKMIKEERTAYDKDGRPVVWTSGSKRGQQVTKQERIEFLEEKLAESETANDALEERLKVVRDLILGTFTLNFKKVAQIILDQCKQGLKQFTRDVMDFLLKSMSSAEKTADGRRSYVNDAFDLVKIMAKTDTDCELDDEAMKPLHEDALRIADGTWNSYHQQRDQLFEAAVKAIVEMGNCSYQRHLNHVQANAIEAFLDFDGSNRKQLCDEIWSEASPKIASCWRTGTHDALEELRKGELYAQGHRKGLSI